VKIKETFSAWLTHRYQLVIRDEENFAEKKPIAYSHAKLLAIFIPLLLLMVGLGIWIGNSLGGSSFGKSDEGKLRRQVIRLSVSVDSLTRALEQHEKFYDNFKVVLNADLAKLKMDTSRIQKKSTRNDSINLDAIQPIDQELRREFEGAVMLQSKSNLQSQGNERLSDIFFFPPLKGIISEKYDAKTKHYGTDIVAKENEPIKAVADGTVIMASWTDDTGNVIAIQHKGNIISIYKHNSVLLRKVGDFVKAGQAIAIVGNTGKYTSGPHLHFELWHEGNPVNAEKVISF
jgi:murein DD-endopeptidase MepM/ murein hydrolase activator NlpD